jgi:hypothetical protein
MKRGENRCLTGRTIIKVIRILAAAALACAAFGAQAQAVDDDLPTTHGRFGIQLGTVQDHNNTEPVAQLSLGYDFNRTWSVEALADVSLLFIRMGALNAGDREFDYAIGGRVLANLPLSDNWSLVGGLGLVKFEDEVGVGSDANNITQSRTTPMVSLAAKYRVSRHWSLGLEVSSFTKVHGVNGGLRAELHF